nr:zinc finger, CCHC-type [Tanacetum cinerariifolium]
MEWYRNLRIVLSVEDKLPFLEELITALPVPAEGQVLPPNFLNTHSAWVKASKKIDGLMLMTMDPDIQKNLEHLDAYDMLKELKTLYAQQTDQELLQTMREFYACKQDEEQFVSSYVLKIKSYIDGNGYNKKGQNPSKTRQNQAQNEKRKKVNRQRSIKSQTRQNRSQGNQKVKRNQS